MLLKEDVNYKEIAIYDRERKGILIHKDQLKDSGLKIGDRFSIKRINHEMFSLTIIKNNDGDIIFDKNGIFIQRNRRVDILLGGIFDEYKINIDPEKPGEIKLKPYEV